MEKSKIEFGAKYKFCSDMIKVSLKEGFKHVPGKGLACKNCKDKYSTRKFLKDRATLYACYKCGARWGSIVK